MPQSFVQIRSNWNEMEKSECQEEPRGLKEAHILFFQPLTIKIYCFDATWVIPQSFVHIRPNWNEMEKSERQEAPRGLKEAYILFYQPLLNKIYRSMLDE